MPTSQGTTTTAASLDAELNGRCSVFKEALDYTFINTSFLPNKERGPVASFFIFGNKHLVELTNFFYIQRQSAAKANQRIDNKKN
jgi:hypothetical protein